MRITNTTVRLLLALNAGIPVIMAQLASTQPHYQITTFYVPPEPPQKKGETAAAGINLPGQVVGDYGVTKGKQVFNRGYIRQPDGTLQYPISDPFDTGQQSTFLTSINDAGVISGYYQGEMGGSSVWHGFLRNNGTFTDISEGGSTAVLSVNNNGDFAGAYGDQQPPQHGFISIGGQLTQVDVLGADLTTIYSLADSGASVGVGLVSQTFQHIAFLRGPKGTIKTFQAATAGQFGTWAAGINSEAQLMVGSYYDASGTVHSFVYNYGASIDTQFPSASALPAVIDPVTIDAGSGGDTYITGVNAKGVITGYFTSHGLRGSYGFIGTPVP